MEFRDGVCRGCVSWYKKVGCTLAMKGMLGSNVGNLLGLGSHVKQVHASSLKEFVQAARVDTGGLSCSFMGVCTRVRQEKGQPFSVSV